MPTEVCDPVPLDTAWIAQALLLSAEAGWNQTAADWTAFFTRGTTLGVIEGERLVATAAIMPYGEAFGWISMVLVTRAWRGRGIATRLVAACTSLLQGAGRMPFLDATPAGAAVYSRIGFMPLCRMQRWHGVGGGVPSTGDAVDLSPDQAVFGADRRFLLDDFLARKGSLGFAANGGFAILRPGAGAMQLGPVVADPAVAADLVRAAIRTATGRLYVDVLEAGESLNSLLSGHGFSVQRGYTRMALGGTSLPGDPTRLLVAAGPEYG